MYAIPTDYDRRLRTNTALRQYARMEYGTDEVAWFLTAIRRPTRTRPRRSLRFRFGLLRAPAPRRAFPHKGAPHLPRPALPSTR